jgi:uncharacterized protein YdaU (DUF1376 family)
MSIIPYFPFYIHDFLSGVKYFSAEETGAYLLLLIEQWDKGFVPDDSKKLKVISKISEKKLKKILEKFEKRSDGYVNKKLEMIRNEKLGIVEKKRVAGQKSAQARSTPVPTPVPTHAPTPVQHMSVYTDTDTDYIDNNCSKEQLSSSSEQDDFRPTQTEHSGEALNLIPETENQPSKNTPTGNKKKAAKKIDSDPEEKKPSLHKKSIEAYVEFYQRVNGVPPKANYGANGKAINSINDYLRQAIAFRDKVDISEVQDDQILGALKLVFDRFSQWDQFDQKLLSLPQIASRIDKILATIKNSTTKNGTPTDNTDKRTEHQKREDENHERVRANVAISSAIAGFKTRGNIGGYEQYPGESIPGRPELQAQAGTAGLPGKHDSGALPFDEFDEA